MHSTCMSWWSPKPGHGACLTKLATNNPLLLCLDFILGAMRAGQRVCSPGQEERVSSIRWARWVEHFPGRQDFRVYPGASRPVDTPDSPTPSRRNQGQINSGPTEAAVDPQRAAALSEQGASPRVLDSSSHTAIQAKFFFCPSPVRDPESPKSHSWSDILHTLVSALANFSQCALLKPQLHRLLALGPHSASFFSYKTRRISNLKDRHGNGNRRTCAKHPK